MKKLTLPKISLEKLTLANLKLWIASIDRKILIQNLTIGGAFLAFIIFFFFPLLIQNKRLSGEVNRLKETVRISTVKIGRIPEMAKQKEQFGARTKIIRAQFFETKESDQLIEIISIIASEAGVKISASRPAARNLELPKPFNESYVALSYDLVMEGQYHNMGAFVNKLERYPKHFAIHELQMVGSEKSLSVPQCTLVLTAFIKRPEAAS